MLLTDQDIIEYRDHFAEYEGRIPHFYLDGENNVTIGIGCLVTDPLAFPLLRKSDNQPARRADIFGEFNAIKALPSGKGAAYYGKFCSLYLPDETIDNIFLDRLKRGISEVEAEIMPLEPLPSQARKVVIDFGFNMGVARFRNKFPNFINYLKESPPNYHGAALESRRLKIQESRNEWAKKVLESLDATTAA